MLWAASFENNTNLENQKLHDAETRGKMGLSSSVHNAVSLCRLSQAETCALNALLVRTWSSG